jgi:hypothetical protein
VAVLFVVLVVAALAGLRRVVPLAAPTATLATLTTNL